MQIVKQEGLKSYSDVWSKRLAGEQPQVYWYKIGFLYEVCKNFKLSNCTLYSAITLMNQLTKATAETMIECISLSSSLREIMPRLSEELIGDHGSQKDNASISQTKKYLYEKILEKRETVALTFCRNFFVKYFDFTPMQKDKLEHWLDLLFFDQLVAHRNTCELVLSVIQHFIREEKLTHLKDDFSQLLLTIKVSSARLKSSENVFLYLRNQASVGQANSKCFSSWKDTTAYNLRTEVRRI
jgi:hypothetical protein